MTLVLIWREEGQPFVWAVRRQPTIERRIYTADGSRSEDIGSTARSAQARCNSRLWSSYRHY